MRALSAVELLGVWERGAEQTLPQRALGLLTAASPETPIGELAQLKISRRDALLLELRTSMFGSRLAIVANCPDCGENLELSFDASELAPREEIHGTPLEFSAVIDEYALRLRPPVTGDLANLDGDSGIANARMHLLENCVISACLNGRTLSPGDLPAEVLAGVEDQMSRADPEANIQLAISCPCCSRRYEATFDIVSFLWSEIGARASRLLREVHTLATAYSWSETEILAMHPHRRQRYQEMIGK